jgi:hypothetical protein
MDRYSFDAVRFCSIVDLEELRPFIHNSSFRKLFYGKIYSKNAKGVARFKYKSWFSGIPKSQDFFFQSCNQLGEFGGTLTYIEIAWDTTFKSEQKAIEAYHALEKTVFLAYQNPTIFLEERKKLDKGFFYGRSLNLGKRSHFQLSVYTRYDKQTNEPILRREFRITENRQILEKLKATHEREFHDPKHLFHLLKKKFYRVGELNPRRIQLLIKYHDTQKTFNKTCDFREFYNEERKHAATHSPRYRLKLKKPFQYYLLNP